MENLILLFFWILFPIVAIAVFSSGTQKAKRVLLYITVIGCVTYILCNVFDIKSKYEMINIGFGMFFYLLILILIAYILELIENKTAKTVYTVLVIVPAAIIILIGSFLILLWSTDSSDIELKKSFITGDYTTYRKVEAWEYTTEEVSINIYKDMPVLSFLHRKVYEMDDVNIELDTVILTSEKNILSLTLSRDSIKTIRLVDLK
ncbi:MULTISPECIES: hypothetical protein [unclassified Dysgonomonas]|uniref:hypothetical protein n=1 Tax=unclassified Dysgonomonas TaxID=2630389 RepID=UPI002473DF4F|nr:MULTISPECIES: hypothetical protein [unclassified Dysgonomonas]